MRSDHTYKAVKCLCAYDTEKERLMPIHAALLVVMDENGFIMRTKICPDDEVCRYINLTLVDLTSTVTYMIPIVIFLIHLGRFKHHFLLPLQLIMWLVIRMDLNI